MKHFLIPLWLTLCPATAHAQAPPSLREAPTVGLHIYSLDGARLGEVVSTSTPRGEQAIIVAMSKPLGFGVETVMVPTYLVQDFGDRLVIMLSEGQIRSYAAPIHDR